MKQKRERSVARATSQRHAQIEVGRRIDDIAERLANAHAPPGPRIAGRARAEAIGVRERGAALAEVLPAIAEAPLAALEPPDDRALIDPVNVEHRVVTHGAQFANRARCAAGPRRDVTPYNA